MEARKIELAPGLNISRVVTGLWQVADLEKEGSVLDPREAVEWLQPYVSAGLASFDTADHYGSSELILGEYIKSCAPQTEFAVSTKLCPPAGPLTRAKVREGVELACSRLGLTCLPLLQLHCWEYWRPSAWLGALRWLAELQAEGRILHIGLTNFDTSHLRVIIRSGLRVVSNQVCYSLLDARAGESDGLAELCEKHGIKLLCYGTLAGGILTDRSLCAGGEADETWSLAKYGRFVKQAGGQESLRPLLETAHRVADKHGVSIANVACRWVLQQRAVAAVIVGARLGRSEHITETLRIFDFELSTADLAALDFARRGLCRVHPGDCGDEYRMPPFLTASGDLSHHIASFPPTLPLTEHSAAADGGSASVSTNTTWERIAAFSRALRLGDGRVLVSGTTSTDENGACVGPEDVRVQHVVDLYCFAFLALGTRVCTDARFLHS